MSWRGHAERMALMAPFRRAVTRSRSRLLDAERRFFDAYSRGGSHDPRSLVVPLTFFADDGVRDHLEKWLSGAELHEDVLERAWRAHVGTQPDAGRFYRNLAHFVSLV